MRALYRRSHPYCERCYRERGVFVPAELVHHLHPVADGGEVLAEGNLESLCRSCHERTHVELR